MPQEVFKGNILLFISGKMINLLKIGKHHVKNYLKNIYTKAISKYKNYTFSKQTGVTININKFYPSEVIYLRGTAKNNDLTQCLLRF